MKCCFHVPLLSVGIMSDQEYNLLLDTLFMEMPEDELLFDLEYASSDISKTIRCHFESASVPTTCCFPRWRPIRLLPTGSELTT